jgi:lipid A ethanolaminephosphotransferase
MKPSWSIRPETAALCLAAFFVAVFNLPFWRQFYAVVAPRDLYELAFFAATLLIALLLLAWFFGALTSPYLFKPAATLLLLITSAIFYFTIEYGIAVDAEMVRNVLATDRAEAADLFTGKLLACVLLLGVLPAALLWASKVAYRPLSADIRFKAKATAAIVAIAAICGLPFNQNFTSVFREHRGLLYSFAPLNYLSAAIDLGRRQVRTGTADAQPFGTDAHTGRAWLSRSGRSLTILVIGETARAANFSLNGYERETNPHLAKVDGLINYSHAMSCGTSTAQSLPCMFSGLGRARFTGHRSAPQEGLLQILQRAGFSVLWRENQGGCAGACRGIPTEMMEKAGNRKLFELGESLDESLLVGLQEKIDGMPGHAVIVLHMMGSHGPAYHKRYPAAFERFQPTCKESQFSRCSRAEIINAYDNTIVYSDFVLARLIELLQANDRAGVPSSMIYLSDHGESLGENNTYLHGLPYVIAPNVQKHVPMLVWLSPSLQSDWHIDRACLERRRHEPLTHDNFFHSVLGLLAIDTSVYERGLDIFAPCMASADIHRVKH